MTISLDAGTGKGKRARTNVELACEAIEAQFPKTPGGALMAAVIKQAIEDAASQETGRETQLIQEEMRQVKADAINYLNGRIIHAELAGIDASWIRRVCKDNGINLTVDSSVMTKEDDELIMALILESERLLKVEREAKRQRGELAKIKIAEKFDCSNAYITKIVKRMEELGMIEPRSAKKVAA